MARRICMTFASVLCVLVLAVPGYCASDPVDLRPHLHKGFEATFVHAVRLEQQIRGDRIDQQIDAYVEMHVCVRVLNADERGARVQLVHKRIISVVDPGSPGSKSERFDSRQPRSEDGEVGRVLRRAVGKPIILELDPTGQITTITGIKAPSLSVANRTLWEEFFSDEAIKSAYSELFHIRREPTTVRIGERWSLMRSEPDQIGHKILRIELTLGGVDGDTAIISNFQFDFR